VPPQLGGLLTSHGLAADIIVALVIGVEEIEELIGSLAVADASVGAVVDEVSTSCKLLCHSI